MKQRTKGISLIVLVITIIVMIILAGAIIVSLTNGNVIAKSKFAKESSDWVNIREMVDMERGNAMFPDATFDNTKTPIPSTYSNDIQITTGGTILLKYNATTKITDIPNAVEKLGAIYIPNGFQYLEGEKDTGLVIKDVSAGITDNEYVWVPVEGVLERKAFRGEDIVTTYTEDTGSTGYTPMKTSVEKYNGFYVSRYEAGANTISTGSYLGMPGISTLAMDGTLKPLSQKNKYVWNFSPWDSSGNYPGSDTSNGLALVAKSAYPSSSQVASSLLYGAQYDAMLTFVNSESTSVTNSITWGNHYNSTFTVSAGAKYSSVSPYTTYTNVSTPITKPANTSWILTTGASEQNKAKNIYDVAGNVDEMTYELRPSDNLRISRSGDCFQSGSSFPASYRWVIYPMGMNLSNGFRFALYIK